MTEQLPTKESLIQNATMICQTSGVYHNETEAIGKFKILLTAQKFGFKNRVSIDRFPSKRCKITPDGEPPTKENKGVPLSDELIKKAHSDAADLYKAILKSEKDFDELKEKTQFTPEVMKEAKEIYESGRFIEYCKDAFRKIWYKDSFVLEGLLYMCASFYVTNANIGIHLFLTGNTQCGKSEGLKHALQFIPPKHKSIKRFSAMWIYYASQKNQLRSRTILFSDDTVLPPEVAELFREIKSSWHTGSQRSVVKNMEALDLYVPARVSLVITAVESQVQESDEGQDESRDLTLEIRRSKDDERQIREFLQQSQEDITKELDVIYAVWNRLTDTGVTLHRKFEDEMVMRDFTRFLTLIKCHAILNNRTITTEEDVTAIKQFLTYSKTMIDSNTAPFTRGEEALYNVLDEEWSPIGDYQTKTKMPVIKLYRAIRGNRGTFECPRGGLLAKTKDVQTRERTVHGEKYESKKIHEIRRIKNK